MTFLDLIREKFNIPTLYSVNNNTYDNIDNIKEYIDDKGNKYILKVSSNLDKFNNEVKIFHYLHNENINFIPEILGSFVYNNYGIIFMKKITYSNFYSIKLKSNIVANIFDKIIDNIILLHSKDIIHLDLHQDNILIHKIDTLDNNEYYDYNPYFIDFEISWDYKNDDFYIFNRYYPIDDNIDYYDFRKKTEIEFKSSYQNFQYSKDEYIEKCKTIEIGRVYNIFLYYCRFNNLSFNEFVEIFNLTQFKTWSKDLLYSFFSYIKKYYNLWYKDYIKYNSYISTLIYYDANLNDFIITREQKYDYGHNENLSILPINNIIKDE